MNTLHFDVSPDSTWRLDGLLSSYGWNHSIAIDMNSASFLLLLLEKELITVAEVPYEYDHDVLSKAPDIGKVYDEIIRDTRWRRNTSIERVRLNALHLLKAYGTPVVSEGKYLLYEDSHVCAYVGNEEVMSLITYLSEHPDLEKWILFPSPVFEGNAYYVFDITPQAISACTKYCDTVREDMFQKIRAATKDIYPDPSKFDDWTT